MESIEPDLETSLDNPIIYHNNDTSSVKLSFGTNATGIVDVFKKGIESPDVEENIYYWEQILHTVKTPVRLLLQFSNKVENLIVHNSIFRKFISQIERSLNDFIEQEKVSLENTILFEGDWEIPDYEKLVLYLNFQGIPFNQEMFLWKKINTLIYGRIKSMILISSEESARKIKELKRNFFIKLVM